MNTSFVIIESATGRIISSGQCQEGTADGAILNPDIQEAIETPDQYLPDQHWFDGENFQELAPLGATWDKQVITADGLDTAILSGLPIPCQVYLDGVVYDVDDGSFEFAAEDPGEYYVWVDHPAHFNQGWTIDAN